MPSTWREGRRCRMMVKHLLEHEKRSVDDLFTHEFDADALAATVLQRL